MNSKLNFLRNDSFISRTSPFFMITLPDKIQLIEERVYFASGTDSAESHAEG